MIKSHVVMRLSSQGKDVMLASMEESYDDGKPKNVYFSLQRSICIYSLSETNTIG